MTADQFRNDPIPIGQLPQLADEAFVPVDPRHLRVSVAAIAPWAVVAAVGTTVLALRPEPAWPVVAVGLGLTLMLVLWCALRVMEVRRLAYQLRDHDLSLRSGVITHRVESLPFSRVQHVNIHRGPIERAVGLATLQVSSAGPDISIPGLTREDAERIKLLVTERADLIAAAEATAEATVDTSFPPPTSARIELEHPTLAAPPAAPLLPPSHPPSHPPPPPSS
ncbi:MAG: PH domain-containing protein [Ilumatobacter sp.]